jgi:hypothetical protein
MALQKIWWFCELGTGFCSSWIDLWITVPVSSKTKVLWDWLIDWLWWDETMSQNCVHQQAYGLSPGWYVSMENHGDDDDSSWGNSWFVHQNSVALLPAETSGSSRRNGRRSDNCTYQYLKCLKGSLTCRKIVRHETSSFTSHPKEGVLRILSPLKIHCLCRVWTRDSWIQWQAHWQLHHRGDVLGTLYN